MRRQAVLIATAFATILGAAASGHTTSNQEPIAQKKDVPTPKDPLFPGFFVNYYTDDAPKVGLLYGVYKTYAVASGKAASLRQNKHVVKAEIEWIDDEGKNHAETVGRSQEELTRIAKSLAVTHLAEYLREPGGQTQCSKFVRDFAKEWSGGRNIPELEGTANEQYDKLKSSATVEKLWIPDGHEADLAEARQSLSEARRLDKERLAAVKNGDLDLARDLEQQRDVERYTARLKADGLQDALRDAQLRANNQGDFVVIAWKGDPPEHGHITVVVPSPEDGETLTPSGDWGLMKMPHIAQAGDQVFPDKTMNYGFKSVESVKGLSIFVIKNP
jgi:hypothetical protein